MAIPQPPPQADDVSSQAETVSGSVQRVIGHDVTVRQGIAQSIEADQVVVNQGAVAQLKTGKATLSSSGIGFAQADTLEMTASHASGVIVRQDVDMDQSGVQVMVTNGPVQMKQSGAVVMVTREAHLENNSGVVFLIAQNVKGDIRPLYGPKEAVIFGAVAGLVGGIAYTVSRVFLRRK